MKGELEKKGKYELFETTHGHKILTLNNKNWFAIVEGQQGKILVKSDSDHEKKKTLQSGEFYLADFEDDPEFKDMPHLFLQEGDKFKEYILPDDLSTKDDKQKKIIEEDEKLNKDKVLHHVKGNGEGGSEKQYQNKNESKSKEEKSSNDKKNGNKSLDDMNKQQLYEKAKEENISGRSKMDKQQLENALEKK